MMETLMHLGKLWLIGGVASAIFISPALAEMTISPEQRTIIRGYVVEERVPPVTIEEDIVVGATLPAEIELVPVPEAWGPELRTYRYLYADDRVVLVEPDTRRVIEVIE
jgi:hypothetical protein